MMYDGSISLALVKYYKEVVSEWKATVPLKVINGKDSRTYVRVSIEDPGILNWTLLDSNDNPVDRIDFDMNNYQAIDKYLPIKASSIPSSTMKDTVTLTVKYYSDSSRTHLFGLDEYEIIINNYIQQPDLSWGSGVVYDYFTFDNIPKHNPSDNETIDGANGRARLLIRAWTHMHGSAKFYIESGESVLQEHSLRSYGGITAWPGFGNTLGLALYPIYSHNDQPIVSEKFIVAVARSDPTGGSTSLGATYTDYPKQDPQKVTIHSGGGQWVAKAVLIPLRDYVRGVIITSYVADYGQNGLINLDSFIIFNEL